MHPWVSKLTRTHVPTQVIVSVCTCECTHVWVCRECYERVLCACVRGG